MENINDVKTNNVPKVNYDDKKYDVFFSYMVENMDPKYRDSEGKIKLEFRPGKIANFKCFSIQVAEQGDQAEIDRKLYTKTYRCDFGYEFDINDRSFNVKFGGYSDLNSSACTDRLVDDEQNFLDKNTQYRKKITEDDRAMYIWNEKINKENGQDIRDIIVPKIISRLETAKEVANKGFNNEEELTEDVYKIHTEKNSFHNSSFTEDDYGSFEYLDDFDLGYCLREMNLSVFKNKDVFFISHNEVGVARKNEKQAFVLPKRLIFNTMFFNTICRSRFEKKMNKYLSEFCDANKIYKSDIRIIDENNRKTQVVSPRQFKEMILNNKNICDKLSDSTKQKLIEMVEICERRHEVKKNNSVGIENDGMYQQQNKVINSNVKAIHTIADKDQYIK